MNVIEVEEIAFTALSNKRPSLAQGIREPFFMGPVRLTWLQLAAKLPGKSLHIALTLCHQAKLNRSEIVHVQPSRMREFSISRHDRYFSLPKMEILGLIEILESRRGKSPKVRLIGHLPEGAKENIK